MTMTGVLVRLHESFGFIRDGGKDFFFHRDQVEPGGATFAEFRLGDAVEFEEIASLKGPRAARVRRVDVAVVPDDHGNR